MLGHCISPSQTASESLAKMNFNAATNKTVLNRYLALKQPDDITQCMYVWIDGTGEHLRAKTKTVKFVPKKPSGDFDAGSPLMCAAFRLTSQNEERKCTG